jgi:ATP-dependent Clp protease ATP-binding subunit ClpA
MFERFTDGARDIVVRAHTEARRAGASRIGTPHLLVAAAPAIPGVAQEPLRAAVGAGSDAAALAAIGIDLDEVRRRVEAAFGPGALSRAGGRRPRRLLGGDAMPFAPSAKRALEGALREAVARGDRDIAAQHVVLGMLRHDDPELRAVLDRAGLDAERLRELALAAREGR